MISENANMVISVFIVFNKSNLFITVPPQEPQIFEHTGMNVRGEVGPYREGSTIELTCIVRDGRSR